MQVAFLNVFLLSMKFCEVCLNTESDSEFIEIF